MKSPELSHNPEQQEGKHPTIRLEFFRHDQPAAAAEGQTDAERKLTQSGREHAQHIGQEKNAEAAMGLAYGSPRDRSQETALRQLLAKESSISSEMDLGQIRSTVDEAMPYGGKVIASEQLDYRVDKNPEFMAAWGKAFSEGRLLPFLLEESDALAKSLHDAEDFSYSRSAANVAEIVKKYIGVSSQWEKTYGANKEKYGDNTEMQRFLGTHQSIGETFLLKVIEKTEGEQAALAFIDQLPSKNGFDVSQGFSIILEPSAGEVKAKLSFGDKTWDVSPKVIDEIISDKEKLDIIM